MLSRRTCWIPIVAVFLATGSSLFAWTVTRSERVSTDGVTHLRREVQGEGSSVEVNIVVVPQKTHALRVIDDPHGGKGMDSALRSAGCVAGVNGGYFQPDHSPLGLLVADGRQIHPIQKTKLLTGMVLVRSGTAAVLRTGEYKSTKGVSQAIQAGPFLVEGHRVVPGLNSSRPAARTAVVAVDRSNVALVVCDSVTLAQFAEILVTRDLFPGGIPVRALNLDGGTSTGLWIRGNGAAFYKAPWKRVRNYLGVVPR